MSIIDYCKEQNVSVSGVVFSPHYDEVKQKVKKGNGIPNVKWNERKHFTKKHSDLVSVKGQYQSPNGWIMSVKQLDMFVIDIDPTKNQTSQEVLKPVMWDWLNENCNYIVETGTKGTHFYFKLPVLPSTFKIKNAIKVDLKWFDGQGDIDLISDAVYVEGSSYSYDNQTYVYKSIKGSIYDVGESEIVWEKIKEFIGYDTEVKKEQDKKLKQEIKDKLKKEDENENDDEISLEEVNSYLQAIPNTDRNWDEWYKMGQTIFNISQNDLAFGYEMFNTWSSKNPFHKEVETYKLWNGLSLRDDNQRGIGSIFYLCKKLNKDGFDYLQSLIPKYAILKELLELECFYVAFPEPHYVKLYEDEFFRLTPSQLAEAYLPAKYKVMEGKYKGEKRSLIPRWKEDCRKRQYQKMVCDPNGTPPGIYNSYRPPIVSKLDEVKDVDFNPIIEHIRLITGEKERGLGTEFIIDFLADIIQYPGRLKGIGLVIYGQEGSGKDILFQWFGDKILGHHLYTNPGNLNRVFGSFNGCLYGKQLIHLEEIERKLFLKYEEDIKRLITNPTISIETKGFNTIEELNCSRVVMTTNNRDAIKISPTDRRFVCFQCNPKEVKNVNYFNQLVSVLNNQSVQRAFYQFLMNRDLSNYTQQNRPKTEIYKEMVQTSLCPIIQWIVSNEIEGYQKTSEYLKMYNVWAESNHTKTYNVINFGSTLKEWSEKIPSGIIKKTPKNVSHFELIKEEVVKYCLENDLIEKDLSESD